MKDLKSALEIVRNSKIKKFESLYDLDPKRRKDNRFVNMSHAILNGEVDDDESASQFEYGIQFIFVPVRIIKCIC
jgi:hypothetical protein